MIDNSWTEEAIDLLRAMIEIPSFSREEDKVANLLEEKLKEFGYQPQRVGNNIWIKGTKWIPGKPVVLFNSHSDTVKPARGWQNDPFKVTDEKGKMIGLGSNDAGAPLVSLLTAFRYLVLKEQSYNLIFCASAEEEISGQGGISSILSLLGNIDLAVVGEPTNMQMAVAEKGLMVVDCESKGKSGHSAREEGVNAIYKALHDIQILQEYRFPKVSDILGSVKMSVTQIEAGSQHNVVPDSCRFVVDVRTNEYYSNKEVAKTIQSLITSEVKPRSYRLNSSSIALTHPLVKRGIELGLTCYGSPTTSDQAVIPATSIKIGPGDSARSHTADEYIYPDEIRQGIEMYVKLLDGLEF